MLTFRADHDLVDFASRDRSRASADDTSWGKQPWSTPLRGFRELDGFRGPAMGEGRWSAPKPEGEFAYLEFPLDAIEFNVASAR